MDKVTFKLLKDIYNAEIEAEMVMSEKGISNDEIDEVLEPFTTLREQLLRIGRYTVEDEFIGKDTYLKKEYDNLRKYTKLTIYYEYENGMALCETTSSSLYLIPKELLADYANDDEEKDVNEEHVVSYWSSEDDMEHVIFCSSRYEAEQKAKEIEESGVDFDDIDIMTRETYDEAELESIEAD